MQHSAQSERPPLTERGADFYSTPPEAVHAQLRAEILPHRLWEPACGDGAIVEVLRGAGHGPRASSAIAFTWFVLDRNHQGPITLDRISWRDE
jgi:hypothetical protein